MWLFSALFVGFLGSFHCVGMCGPIALALPNGKPGAGSFIKGRFLYNLGRILTYSILGLVVGSIGQTIALAGYQKVFSILTGLIIMITVFIPFVLKNPGFMNGIFVRYTSGIKQLFRKLFGLKSSLTLFLIGIVNGLLPCGFVYLALAGAAASGSILNSFSYMLLFGLGTVPVMFTITSAGRFFSIKTQMKIRKFSPLIAVFMAIILIARGILVSPHSCCMHH